MNSIHEEEGEDSEQKKTGHYVWRCPLPGSVYFSGKTDASPILSQPKGVSCIIVLLNFSIKKK